MGAGVLSVTGLLRARQVMIASAISLLRPGTTNLGATTLGARIPGTRAPGVATLGATTALGVQTLGAEATTPGAATAHGASTLGETTPGPTRPGIPTLTQLQTQTCGQLPHSAMSTTLLLILPTMHTRSSTTTGTKVARAAACKEGIRMSHLLSSI